ncbi:hypothetical protein [Micromonospora sp. WMMD812]|uniref:hypothetical protein n=1 Tax=Micromonospora sp. WMMD812 TaxID=3015152 RepID=UPI00248CFB22|nr:hypothetical protein [Micromonospora sp. WMMD812]WBB67849.1 hypothetical protein O7603_00270 [Micromonospora sp. WMMD812]
MAARAIAAPSGPPTVDRAAGRGLADVVEAVAPVTRPVVDAAVRAIAGTGLLPPVAAAVRPVVEPIVGSLSPVLTPVLGLTRPILDNPAPPVVSPGQPVTPTGEPVPPPGPEAVPVATTPGTAERVPPRAAIRTHRPAVSSAPDQTVAATQRVGAERAADAAARASRGSAGGGTLSGGLTPATLGSAAGSASAGTATAVVADVSPHLWTPRLSPQGCAPPRCGVLTGRPLQPDTRPA